MKGYCSLNMHVDVATSWLYMLYYSVAVYYYYFFFILLSYYYVHRMPKMLLKLPHLP